MDGQRKEAPRAARRMAVGGVIDRDENFVRAAIGHLGTHSRHRRAMLQHPVERARSDAAQVAAGAAGGQGAGVQGGPADQVQSGQGQAGQGQRPYGGRQQYGDRGGRPQQGGRKPFGRQQGGKPREFNRPPPKAKPKPLIPITKAMKEGREPLRTFSDLFQFHQLQSTADQPAVTQPAVDSTTAKAEESNPTVVSATESQNSIAEASAPNDGAPATNSISQAPHENVDTSAGPSEASSTSSDSADQSADAAERVEATSNIGSV